MRGFTEFRDVTVRLDWDGGQNACVSAVAPRADGTSAGLAIRRFKRSRTDPHSAGNPRNEGSMIMRRILAGLVLTTIFVPAAVAEVDLNRYIAERAANCWATPTAMRGIKLDVALEVRFTREGHVDLVQIADFLPESETARVLALDFAEALKRCGPYATEGLREMKLNFSWPM